MCVGVRVCVCVCVRQYMCMCVAWVCVCVGRWVGGCVHAFVCMSAGCYI